MRNPSQSEAIDELSLYIDQALLYLADLELPCQTDARTQAEGISLEPQQNAQLRLQISLDAEQVEMLKTTTINKALLQLPYSYFRPPKRLARCHL